MISYERRVLGSYITSWFTSLLSRFDEEIKLLVAFKSISHGDSLTRTAIGFHTHAKMMV